MKTIERFQFLANVLIVACSRPNAEVGKLVKAVVTYATEGIKTDLGDLRLEAYFDLLIQDIDSLRTAAEAKSKKCSESAKCRTTRNASSPTIPAKKANAANATTVKPKAIAETVMVSSDTDCANVVDCPDESKSSNEGIHTSESDNEARIDRFNASDATSSFDRMKIIYKKIGDNESQAFGVWQQLSEDERTAAFAHTQRLQGGVDNN